MQRAINPMIDSAFKALFADEAHSHLLASLLTAVVQPELPILSLEYLDPADEPERLHGRRTVVDVKARDSTGHVYQVEVQVVLHDAMPERMALTWARLFDSQFRRGQPYSALLPVTSVWILDRRFWGDGQVHREFALRDDDGKRLTSHCNLHILELANMGARAPDGPLEKWLYFLKNARGWTALPPALDRGVLREAMSVMNRFSMNDQQYYRYMAELDAESVEATRRESMRKATSGLASTTRELADANELLELTKSELASKKTELASKKTELASKDKQLDDMGSELARLSALVRELSNKSDP